VTVIRPTAVAGAFYPDRPDVLARDVKSLIDGVGNVDASVPKAIIAPHAGYRYSGGVAARVYARLKPAAGTISRVVLLGPCHRVAVRGLAVPTVDAFASPLGDVPLDKRTIARLLEMPQVSAFDATHKDEHSLEVHLPFLQSVLGDFELVPLVVGDASIEDVSEVLDAVWGGPETLIVISSDLSHFLDYDSARSIDARTCHAIETLNPEAIGRDQACGRIPVRGLLATAKRRGMQVETVDIRNSGDTAGPRDRVVGYGAWAFTEPAAKKTETAHDDGHDSFLGKSGPILLRVAAASIEHGLEFASPLPTQIDRAAPELAAQGASFVTLKKSGQLRGCIGSPEAHQPLIRDVAQNAFRAAFKDPRFPPVTAMELPALSLSVSVLTPQTPMTFTDEADLLAQLRPGVDGLVISDGGRRALFLPSVWEQLPDPRTFLGHLKRKAGLSESHWSPGFQALRFTAGEVRQQDMSDPKSLWRGSTPY